MTVPEDALRAGAPAVHRYTRVAVALHWSIAVAIGANATLAWSVDRLPDDWVRPVIDTHKSIGVTILGFVLMRILWRLGHAPPPLPLAYPRWERFAAHLGHALLYVLIVAIPVTGWMHDSAWKDAATHPMRWFQLVEWPRIPLIMNLDPAIKEPLHTLFGHFHTWSGYALYALLALHVGAALKHQWVDKHPELQRIAF
jgi:cytochrome b561